MTGNLKHTLSQGVWVLRDQRHMAELPPRPRLLAVAVQVRAGDRQDRRRVRLAADHVDHRDVLPDAVAPSGKPRIARRWFSNWLVSAPSIVQCPELCTRGAISLASSPPSALRTARSRARRRNPSAPAIARAYASAGAWSSRGESGAGAYDTRRIPSRWMVLDERIAAQLAVAAARRQHRQLAVEAARTPPGSSGTPPSAPRPPLERPRAAQHRLPLAVVAEPARLQHRREADRVDGDRQLGEVSTAANGGSRHARAASKSVFSASRSCATSSAAGGGRTGTRRERPRRVDRHVLELVGHDVDAGGEAARARRGSS